ncbi:MAG: M1 family metallopeptidase [bacterium]|nr:M1 family metallopeptidase [bacterium]
MRFKIVIFVLSLPILVACAMATASDAAPPTENGMPFDTLDYDLRLKIDYENEKLSGTSRMTIANASGEPARVVPMLLYRLMKVSSVKDDEGKSLSFKQEVLSFEGYPQLQANSIEIELEEAVDPGQKIVLTVAYGGYLLGRAEVWGYVRDRIDRDFTIIREDCAPYPSIGLPSRRMSRMKIQQRFTYTVKITVPESLVVANGGELIDRSEADGWVSYTYRSLKPSWRMDFAIADYHLEKDGTNRVFCLREDADRGETILKALNSSMELYTRWFGPLKDSQGLTVIEIPDDWGSQTDVTTIIQTAAAFKDDSRLYELYHEATHMWGVKSLDDVAPRWEEGLACFLQYVTVEKLEEGKILDDNLQGILEYLQGVYAENPEYATVPLADFGKKDMTDLSYTVGRIFFAVLYDLVGEHDFNTIIGSFYQEFFEPGATTSDFLTHAQKKTRIDLDRLFNEWFQEARYSEYILSGKTVAQIADVYRAEVR